MTIGERIKNARETKQFTQEQLGVLCNTTKQTIFKYETGIITNIPLDRLEKIADVLDVSPAYLMGWDIDAPSTYPSNLIRLEPMQKIPLVGRIACGEPVLAVENIEDYIDLPRQIHADFALTCKGDSMINAGIQDGDVVYIKEQPTVENGQIAAVMIGDEATLKRFYHTEDSVRLVAENPTFPTLSFFGEEMAQIRVIGLAVGYTHALI